MSAFRSVLSNEIYRGHQLVVGRPAQAPAPWLAQGWVSRWLGDAPGERLQSLIRNGGHSLATVLAKPWPALWVVVDSQGAHVVGEATEPAPADAVLVYATPTALQRAAGRELSMTESLQWLRDEIKEVGAYLGQKTYAYVVYGPHNEVVAQSDSVYAPPDELDLHSVVDGHLNND